MKTSLFISILFSILILITGCFYDVKEELYPVTEAECDSTNVSFTTTVLPILTASCNYSSCHNTTDNAGGIALDTYDAVVISANNGGLLGSIKGRNGNAATMPKGTLALDDCTIGKIENWVNNGVLNN